MRVAVEAPVRLHLGFYRRCSPLSGLRLGGVGVAADLEGLTTRVVLDADSAAGDKLRVEAPSSCLKDALEAAQRAAGLYRVGGRLRVVDCLPRHVGLGSTTQLVASIYAAFGAAVGVDVEEAVMASGRGRFSGVGVGVFLRGGLVADTGLKPGTHVARPMAWSWPPPWGIVVAIPRVEQSKLVAEGPEEDATMEAVLGSNKCSLHNSYAVLLDAVFAGAAMADFELFVQGVELLEEATAELFGEKQGGAYCCSEAEEAARALRSIGARGVGQSSWGPTVYGFFPSRGSAVAAAARLRSILPNAFVAAGAIRRQGATIKLSL